MTESLGKTVGSKTGKPAARLRLLLTIFSLSEARQVRADNHRPHLSAKGHIRAVEIIRIMMEIRHLLLIKEDRSLLMTITSRIWEIQIWIIFHFKEI